MTIEQLMGSLQAYEEKKKKKESRINFSSYTLIEELVPIIELDKDENADIKDEEEDKEKDLVGGLVKTTITTKEDRENQQKVVDRATQGQRYDKSNIKCYNCQKFGHQTSECRSPRNNIVEEKTNYI